jgi:hypothetical protein
VSGETEMTFDKWLPVRDDEGRRIAYTCGLGRIRMHPDNADHLSDVYVKEGPDLRAATFVWSPKPPPPLEPRFFFGAFGWTP